MDELHSKDGDKGVEMKEPFVSIALRYEDGVDSLSARLWHDGGRALLVHIRFPAMKNYVLLDRASAKVFGEALLHLAGEIEE